MTASSNTRVSRCPSGYCIRIEGRGTLRESPAVHAFVRHVLDGEPGTATIDLRDCDYLDSTFLGCLVDLHRRYAMHGPVRMLVAAPPERRQRLFAPNCLDELFCYGGDPPEIVGEELSLPSLTLERDDLGRHVLECHRRLVELGGPNRAALQGVVERLAHELVAR
jgi:anti-anti-sigma regulatory factor